jgi:hypothetical protein
MFEVLTKEEAQALRNTLLQGYEKSRVVCRKSAASMTRCTPDESARAFAKMAHEQAKMRSELTGIVSQIRHEVLGWS